MPANDDTRLGKEDARIAAAVSSLTPQQFRLLAMLGDSLRDKQVTFAELANY